MPQSKTGETRYDIKIVRRQFWTVSDDWHATITRRSDGKKLFRERTWLWLLKLELRPVSRLDRMFAAAERYEAEALRTVEWSV
jgi:hypothetical protein